MVNLKACLVLIKNGGACVAVLTVLFLCITTAGRTAMKPDSPEGEKEMTGTKILAALKRHKDGLMAIPGVAGVAEGRCDGEPCIKVYVTKKTPAISGKIPPRLEGFPVSVEETGEFKSLQE